MRAQHEPSLPPGTPQRGPASLWEAPGAGRGQRGGDTSLSQPHDAGARGMSLTCRMGREISNTSIYFFLLPIPNHTPSAGSLKCSDLREKSITHCSHFPNKTSLWTLHLQDREGSALLVVLCWLPIVPVCSNSLAPLPRSRVPSTGGFGQAAWAKLCSPVAAELAWFRQRSGALLQGNTPSKCQKAAFLQPLVGQ